jgi:hypothetical protein
MSVTIMSLNDASDLSCNVAYLRKYFSLAAAYGWKAPAAPSDTAVPRLSDHEAITLAEAFERILADADTGRSETFPMPVNTDFLKMLVEILRKGACLIT